eukprot:scaffold185929_cov39-Prasinocladus_malaysianus.AAC.1
MEDSKSKVEAEISTLSDHHALVCKEIEDNFDKIEAAVKERRAALLRDAGDLRTSKEQTLKDQMEELEAAISNVTDAIERSAGLINYSNDLEIVERQALVESRLKKMTLSGSAPVRHCPSHAAKDAGSRVIINLRATFCTKEAARSSLHNANKYRLPALFWQEPRESGTLSVALFSHIKAAVAGYGSVRGTPSAAATAHKHQLEKLVSEADKILSNRVKVQAVDGNPPPDTAVATSDGSYCVIM